MKMQQDRTDYGTRGESGERIPAKAKASDTSGERRVSVPRADRESGTRGESGESMPKAKASDATGERRVGITGGVGMGKADATGRESDHGKFDGHVGESNTGRQGDSKTVYRHTKPDYR